MLIDTHAHFKTKSTIHSLSHSGISFTRTEHITLNGNALWQKIIKISGKEYPMKDETKTSAEIQANEFR